MTAENYHLKWDSHLSYLNSSVATLYKNEKYADVVLYSSNTTGSVTNAMPTVGISAHKFILSSCSQFFSSIFETSPITNNGIFYIVLPPDLSHRAIQILVQYMYVGEATVSNDILSEVLRGGEILKIRGLCRTSANTSNTTTIQQPTQNRNAEVQTTVNSSSSYNLTRMPMSSGPTSVRYLMEQQQQQHSRGLGASVMPKDSPVIIKSPKPLSTLASSTAAIAKPATSGITINKQVAIDPGDKCCYAQDSLAANAGVNDSASSICNEIGCNSCPRVADNLQPMILRRERSQSDDPSVLCRKSCLERCDEQSYLRHTSNDCRDEEEEEDSSNRLYEHEMRRSSLPAERTDIIHDYPVSEHYPNNLSHISHSKHSIIRENTVETNPGGGMANDIARLPSPNHTQEPPPHFVTIKEEPTDWLPSSSSSSLTHPNNAESSSKIINKVENFQTTHIKTESSPSSIHNMENDCRQMLPAPSTVLQQPPPIANDFERYFSCDICNKTCEDKASLVRHLETHTATPCSSGFNNQSTVSEAATLPKSYVPKKRRRISQQENSTDHVCLQCDLCSTRFETPAEWVRHMSSQHTEVELAMFNNKKDKEKHNSSSSNNNLKKHNSQRQPHQQQQQQSHQSRTQVLNGSTNSNLSNSTSVLCTSPNQTRHEANADYLRSTLSPA